MKKLLIVLSLTAMLTACGGSSSKPQQKDPNALPDGIMQPVAGTGAVAGGSFMPEIQHESMPKQMK